MKAGDLIYDEKGKQAPDYRELRDTYETYHVSDLNVAGSQPRTPPNGSPSAVNAERGLRRAVQGEGEAERLPTDDERTAMVVTDEVKKVIDDQRNIKGVTVAQDVGSITKARFRIKDGKANIEIPPAEKFSDIHRQASSVVQTCPHSQLYAAAATRIAVATEAGHKDPAAEDGVPACKAPLKSRDASEEYGRAELAATYATLNRVTQIVMNAPDPLLVELIVGPDHIDPLISMLRRHYATVRERCPVPFADVERVWRIQRQWWLQFVVDAHEADAASGGGGVPSAPRSARVRSRASALSARRLYTPRRRLLSCNRPSGSAHV